MAKKKVKKEAWISGFILLIMVMSVFGFVLNYSTPQQNQAFTYQGYQFTPTQRGTFQTQVNGETVQFYNAPSSVEGMELPNNVVNNLGRVRFTQDLNDTLARPITGVIFDVSRKTQAGVGYTTNATNRPKITCESPGRVVYMHSGNQTRINQDGMCTDVTVSTAQGAARVRDALLYRYYGIIQ